LNPKQLFLNDPDIALKTYIILPRDYAPLVLTQLLKLGVFEPISQESPKFEEIKRYVELVEGAKKLLDFLNTYIVERVEVEIRDIPADTEEAIRKLYDKLKPIADLVEELGKKMSEYREELRNLELLRSYVEYVSVKYPEADTTLLDYEGSLLAVKTFIGVQEALNEVKKVVEGVVAEYAKDSNAIITVVLRREVLEELSKKVSGNIKVVEITKRFGVSSLRSFLGMIANEITSVESELKKIGESIGKIIKENINDIALLKVLIDAESSKIELLRTALHSKYMTLIMGWVPKSRKGEVLSILKSIPHNIVFEEDPNPPVDFNNLRPFKPFEMFTELNGYPSPNEWDPTPLLTYLYIFFFSLMFSDIGYAIGLFIGARYVLPLFVENPDTLKKLRRIAYITAVAGAVAGILSGSFFGSLLGKFIPKQIQVLPSLPPMLKETHPGEIVDTIMFYLKLSLAIGYIVTIFSHVIGLAKAAIKSRDLWGVLAEASIITIMVFGPAFIMHSFGIKQRIDLLNISSLLPADVINYIIYASLAIFIVTKIKSTGPMGAFLWIFDVAGVLGDVFSFTRIAGIAMGSAFLAEIFNGFIYSAVNLAPVIGIIAGIALAFTLHLLNLASSVLGPYIHSLRLILYEVSSKFYEGSGRKINPVKIVLGIIKI
jgi:V/A-type H+-transporting ATPase subunit I